MKFTGRARIAASPQIVWRGLNDPKLLQSCIPGCEELEKTGPADFAGAVTVRIGPIKAIFQSSWSLSGQEPPLRCIVTAEAQDGVAGFARGQAGLLLSPTDRGTELSYIAEVELGGKLAQLDQGMIDDAAQQLAGQFFAAFEAGLAPAGMPAPAPRPESAPAPSGGPLIWMTGLVAVAAILILMFTVVM